MDQNKEVEGEEVINSYTKIQFDHEAYTNKNAYKNTIPTSNNNKEMKFHQFNTNKLNNDRVNFSNYYDNQPQQVNHPKFPSKSSDVSQSTSINVRFDLSFLEYDLGF